MTYLLFVHQESLTFILNNTSLIGIHTTARDPYSLQVFRADAEYIRPGAR